MATVRPQSASVAGQKPHSNKITYDFLNPLSYHPHLQGVLQEPPRATQKPGTPAATLPPKAQVQPQVQPLHQEQSIIRSPPRSGSTRVGYIKETKKLIKNIERDFKDAQVHMQVLEHQGRIADQWKMGRFSDIPPRVKVVKPNIKEETQKLAQRESQVKQLLDKKHYIKSNLKQVKQIETQIQTSIKAQVETTKQLSAVKAQTPKGAIPKYLQERKDELEQDRKDTLQQIELNKRPPGTRILVGNEKDQILEQLLKQKHDLETKQQSMSVTHFTQRARNQYMDYVAQIKTLDDSIKVLQRKRFIMNDQA
ncbi:hypothetical protein FGO68_gene12533 [Halteria grandinella]|uniref:Enkurin domain-containing protein n=1 Tax=Halteria grandinella TaxID=5974 RepID=A0A8J8T0C7_HALGN|nr:hypothetical protein FGO68_gene12533 [Halteria grandinella]